VRGVIMKTFVIIPALVLAAGLTLAGCGTAKARPQSRSYSRGMGA
jgi:hypothetical protein